MHIIQVVRHYMGVTQQELAKSAGITQPDLCEMEIKEPYGLVDKYARLSEYLSIPIHALVTDDCSMIPLSFFEKHPHRPYATGCTSKALALGRSGEDAAFAFEVNRLAPVNPSLSKLVIPFYKQRHRPGYDILSFTENGHPYFIEVKTTTDDNPDFVLTKQEHAAAVKAVAKGEIYKIFRYINFGKEDQALFVHDFQELQSSGEISPATYFCNTAPKEDATSGIAYYRELAGLSKSELADYLGIRTPDLWRYETGYRKCPVSVYRKIASILNVTIDQLIDGNN